MSSNQDDLRQALQSAYQFEPDFPHPALLAHISADLKSGAMRDGRLSWIGGATAAALAVVTVVALIGFQRFASPGPHQAAVSPASVSPASQTPSPTPSPAAPLVISSAAFHDGEVGVVYGPVTLSAGGGVPPYTWSVIAGNLPNGLTLDPNGIVSGTPGSAGAANFTVQVADSANVTASAPESMKTAPALTASYLPECAGGNCGAEVGCAPGGCGKFGYVSGGSPPYSFSVTAGTLPPGTELLRSGDLGVPPNILWLYGPFNAPAGTYNFQVTVTDGLGGKASLNPTFRVAPRLWFSPNNFGSCTGDFNTGCSLRLPYTGGVGTVSASASEYASPPLPPGFSVVVSGGAVTITFPSGMVSGWKGVVYVQIHDNYTTNACCPANVTVEVRPKGQ